MKYMPLLTLLPATLFAQGDMWDDEDWGDEEATHAWTGFIEAGYGSRFEPDALLESNTTLGEIRLRLESDWQVKKATISAKADLVYDDVMEGWDADFRDLTIAFAAGSTDFRFGRQVQTWGTGDLVFLNDLFPKDYVSFFAGREDEYLKAPGDSLRITHFNSLVNIDFVWTPTFEPDIYLTGKRFSFFSPFASENVAPDPPLSALEPGESFSNGEFALRLFRTIHGREYALYGYHGFFKQPTALTSEFEPTFAPLTAIGASLRQALGPGLFNAETAWYLSRDDRDGNDPLLPNDQLRLLLGYEWEARPRFTVGLQYYLEWTLDHGELLANSLAPQFEPDQYRHLLTNRLTWRSDRDRHTLSLFMFFSPSDRDFHVRPVYAFRYDDHWSLSAGANLFSGKDDHTFFGQLQDANNTYLRLRYLY